MNRITETTTRLGELFSYLVNPVNPVCFFGNTRSMTGFTRWNRITETTINDRIYKMNRITENNNKTRGTFSPILLIL